MSAGAFGMQVTISTDQFNARGLGSATAGFWLNDVPLPNVPEQSILLGVTPIPEPTVAWMIGTGLLVLAGTRRRSL